MQFYAETLGVDKEITIALMVTFPCIICGGFYEIANTLVAAHILQKKNIYRTDYQLEEESINNCRLYLIGS